MASQQDNTTLLCVRQIRQVEKLDLGTLGYLIIRVDLEYLMNHSSASHYLDNPDYKVLFYEGDRRIYPPLNGEEDDKLFLQAVPDTTENYSIIKLQGQKIFLIQNILSDINPKWSIFWGVSYHNIFRSTIASNILYIVMVVAAIIFSIIISSVLVRTITSRFNLLITKMSRLQSGDFNVLPTPEPAHPESQDELELLNRYFDEMTVEFKKMIDDNYIKEMLIAQSQLKSLEQQINPHFLYNTLDSVKWFAKRSGEENIITIVESLAILLRTNLNKEADTIPISQELAVVESYVKIQQIRFSDVLKVDFDVDESILGCAIPKMTIQPLVENAIVHSSEYSIDLCLVTVRVKDRGDTIYVAVENDGSEIDTDILKHLKDHSASPKGNGVGLINIDSRLKILFGEQAGLSFENRDETVIVSFIIEKRK